MLLALIEDDFLVREFRFTAPVQTMRRVSYDLTVRDSYELEDGDHITALDVQWELFDRARKYADSGGTWTGSAAPASWTRSSTGGRPCSPGSRPTR